MAYFDELSWQNSLKFDKNTKKLKRILKINILPFIYIIQANYFLPEHHNIIPKLSLYISNITYARIKITPTDYISISASYDLNRTLNLIYSNFFSTSCFFKKDSFWLLPWLLPSPCIIFVDQMARCIKMLFD